MHSAGLEPIARARVDAPLTLTRARQMRPAVHAVASSAGHVAVVELLLQYRSAVNRKDTFGKTPLMNAVFHNHLAIVRILLKVCACAYRACGMWHVTRSTRPS